MFWKDSFVILILIGFLNSHTFKNIFLTPKIINVFLIRRQSEEGFTYNAYTVSICMYSVQNKLPFMNFPKKNPYICLCNLHLSCKEKIFMKKRSLNNCNYLDFISASIRIETSPTAPITARYSAK